MVNALLAPNFSLCRSRLALLIRAPPPRGCGRALWPHRGEHNFVVRPPALFPRPPPPTDHKQPSEYPAQSVLRSALIVSLISRFGSPGRPVLRGCDASRATPRLGCQYSQTFQKPCLFMQRGPVLRHVYNPAFGCGRCGFKGQGDQRD